MGILYGIIVAVSFTLFATVGIVEYMGKMISSLVPPGTQNLNIPFLNSMYNATFAVGDLTLMVYAIILIHAAVSSIMVVVLKGGNLAGTLVHFLMMVWIGVATSFAVDMILTGMLSL